MSMTNKVRWQDQTEVKIQKVLIAVNVLLFRKHQEHLKLEITLNEIKYDLTNFCVRIYLIWQYFFIPVIYQAFNIL